jgi:hypothetical protein
VILNLLALIDIGVTCSMGEPPCQRRAPVARGKLAVARGGGENK